MLLITRLRRRVAPRRNDDAGSALVAVLGVMAVGLIVIAVVASSLVAALGTTTASRASVQAQAAAESGIAIARVGLQQGTCAAKAGTYVSANGATPRFSATVWRASGSSWVQGCPTDVASQVRIVSTGFAAAPGVAANSSGDQISVEAILGAAANPTDFGAGGPAIYAYSSAGFTASGKVVSVNGSVPTIMVKTGNVACSGASSGAGNFIVDAGALSMTGSCNVDGNVWSSGRTTMDGGVRVGGTVVAAGLSVPNGVIGGSAWSSTDIQMSGGGSQIGGNATGSSLTFVSGGKILGNAWVTGATKMDWGSNIAGDLTTRSYSQPQYSSGLVSGKTTVVPGGPGASPYATPARPPVTTWVDFAYNPGNWSGFTEVKLSGSCTFTQLASAVQSLGTKPGLIDARSCTTGIRIDGANKLALRSDVAVVANKFALTGGGGFTANAASRLWLITTDQVANAKPDCPSGSTYQIDGGFTFSPNLAVQLYTPCKVVLGSGTSLRGQLFAGQAGIAGDATLAFVPVGLPGGYNFSGQQTGNNNGGDGNTTPIRALLSQRNISAAG